jgi:hypothetical protein
MGWVPFDKKTAVRGRRTAVRFRLPEQGEGSANLSFQPIPVDNFGLLSRTARFRGGEELHVRIKSKALTSI